MLAEPYSASLLSRFSAPDKQLAPKGYYRSKLFIASSTTNPLLAAAAPLFSLLERLCISLTLPPIENMRSSIEHEMHAFHSRLMSQDYGTELIISARYLLSATIDELLGKNYLRLNGEAAQFKAFTPYSADNVEPQKRFFEMVHFIKERANQYLDLLELAYYCLIAGFEGEHHLQTDGRYVLDNLIEELYQLIQHHRAHKPHRLFQKATQTNPISVTHKRIGVAFLLTLCTLGATYLFSQALLEHKAKIVLIEQSSIDEMGR